MENWPISWPLPWTISVGLWVCANISCPNHLSISQQQICQATIFVQYQTPRHIQYLHMAYRLWIIWRKPVKITCLKWPGTVVRTIESFYILRNGGILDTFWFGPRNLHNCKFIMITSGSWTENHHGKSQCSIGMWIIELNWPSIPLQTSVYKINSDDPSINQ